jgi:hypothetical protein
LSLMVGASCMRCETFLTVHYYFNRIFFFKRFSSIIYLFLFEIV